MTMLLFFFLRYYIETQPNWKYVHSTKKNEKQTKKRKSGSLGKLWGSQEVYGEENVKIWWEFFQSFFIERPEEVQQDLGQHQAASSGFHVELPAVLEKAWSGDVGAKKPLFREGESGGNA